MKILNLQISANHPTGSGHFPGNPIIPGALLLANVLCSIGQAEGLSFKSCDVKSVKFQYPARPGDLVNIEYSYSLQGAIGFKCTVAETLVMSGGISVNVHVE